MQMCDDRLLRDSSHGKWNLTFWGDVALLAVAAPLLYFPQFFGYWFCGLGVLLLAGGWFWRRVRLGYWYIRTPADWPLLLIFLGSLPLSVLIASASLRQEYSVPRALILLWNVNLLCAVVVHCGRSARLLRWCVRGFIGAGFVVACTAVFGTQWSSKIPALSPLLDRLPGVFLGFFSGAESGFSPNQLAGTLLTVIPLVIALFALELLTQRRIYHLVGQGAVLAVMCSVLLLSQSRTGYVGFGVALLILALGPWRWGRRLLLAALLLLLVAALLLPIPSLLIGLDAVTSSDIGFGGINMASRLEIWSHAVYAIQDFPLTGIGLGTFRQLVVLLYPLTTVPPGYDIAHAHSFYLQSALDLGIPGLVALLALIGLAAWQGMVLVGPSNANHTRAMAFGLLAGLTGQAVYSLADAVALGAKTNLFFWFLLALLLGMGIARAYVPPQLLSDRTAAIPITTRPT